MPYMQSTTRTLLQARTPSPATATRPRCAVCARPDCTNTICAEIAADAALLAMDRAPELHFALTPYPDPCPFPGHDFYECEPRVEVSTQHFRALDAALCLVCQSAPRTRNRLGLRSLTCGSPRCEHLATTQGRPR